MQIFTSKKSTGQNPGFFTGKKSFHITNLNKLWTLKTRLRQASSHRTSTDTDLYGDTSPKTELFRSLAIKIK